MLVFTFFSNFLNKLHTNLKDKKWYFTEFTSRLSVTSFLKIPNHLFETERNEVSQRKHWKLNIVPWNVNTCIVASPSCLVEFLLAIFWAVFTGFLAFSLSRAKEVYLCLSKKLYFSSNQGRTGSLWRTLLFVFGSSKGDNGFETREDKGDREGIFHTHPIP